MILDYFRPKTIEESLFLLQKHENAIPIAGGTTVKNIKKDFFAIDLQDLDLKYLKVENSQILIGATTTIDQIYDYFRSNTVLTRAIKIDYSKNQRMQSTIGGAIMAGDGRSTLLTCLLALECHVYIEPGKKVL
jgi:CO/xanthine dehydrogenase FAD-binding subunit